MKTTLLFVSVSIAGAVFGQTTYTVSLPNKNIGQCKEFLTEVDREISDGYARQIAENQIIFSTATHYSTEYIKSIFINAGATNVQVTDNRGPDLVTDKAGGVDCELAMQLCSNSSVPGNSSGFGIQELPNDNTVDGCLSLEHQSSWYYINVQTGGSMSLRINPTFNGDDYDFAIWGPFTAANVGSNCSPITNPVRCSYSATTGNTGIRAGEPDVSEGAGGDRWVDALTVASNDIFILLVDNFSISGTGYNIDFSWGGNTTTAVIGCTPVVLPIELSSFTAAYEYGKNAISWSTEAEVNNDFFELEWSSNPTQGWKSIGLVEGAGNSQNKLNYRFDHPSYERNSLNYYRIKQTDFNGTQRAYPTTIVVDNTYKAMKIEKVVNFIGQEVSIDEKGLVIYIYEDGSREKVMKY